MAIEDYVRLSDDAECINCGATIYKFLDRRDNTEFWATDMGISTCGRSGKFHVPMGM